jgi:hypothetical protein
MNIIVVYPGRFHPFHRGHKASYDYLGKKFGVDNVYIATSDVQAPVTSPFSYGDKVAMTSKLGIPAGHVIKVKNPYQVKEITDGLPDPENTALIYAISEKDMQGDAARFKFGTKKNGDPSYMQPMPENIKQLKPLTKHAYVTVTPTVNFKVKGVDANSASEVRKLYMNSNDAGRDQIIADLYGEAYPELRDIFDKRIGLNQKVHDVIYGTPIVTDNSRAEPPMQREHKQRLVRVLESIQQLERRANKHYQPLIEDLREDYLDEKK